MGFPSCPLCGDPVDIFGDHTVSCDKGKKNRRQFAIQDWLIHLLQSNGIACARDAWSSPTHGSDPLISSSPTVGCVAQGTVRRIAIFQNWNISLLRWIFSIPSSTLLQKRSIFWRRLKKCPRYAFSRCEGTRAQVCFFVVLAGQKTCASE